MYDPIEVKEEQEVKKDFTPTGITLTPQNRIQKTQQSEAIKNISNKVEKIC